MTEYAKVTRPEEGAGPPEVKAYLASLGRALEHIGIDYGQEFAVVPGDSIGTQASLDDLDDQLGPFAKDSETSRQAAIDTYERMRDHHLLLLHVIGATGDSGMTRDEMEVRTHLEGNTIRPRVDELVKGKMLEVTTRTRLTRKMSRAKVIVITPHGRAEMLKAEAKKRRQRGD